MDIQQIPVDMIDPHPRNPRRDLGDLTELADSIRSQGIRQNLLITPWGEGRYRAIIGHRRLAAAKLAGLVDVPAAIDPDISATGQLELMLLENIQRNDLSPIEEAQGYQDLLDLGVKPTMIARQTGRSRKTVEARIKLLALPDAARQKVHTHQLSLEDAAAIGEFDDDATVSQLLRFAGTNEWKWEVQNARKRRDDKATRDAIIAKLDALGFEPVPDDAQTWRDWTTVATFKNADEVGDADEYPDDAAYQSASYSAIVTLWQPKPVDAAATAAEEARAEAAAEARAKRDADQAAGEAALALRDAFVHATMSRKLTTTEKAAIVTAYAAGVLDRDLWSLWDLTRWLNTGTKDSSGDQWRSKYPRATPEHLFLAMLHTAERNPYRWPDVEPGLVDLYALLEQLGYEISDAEAAALAEEEAPDETPVIGRIHPDDEA